MASRERANRIKIGLHKVGQVPINAAETIFQGDLLVWDTVNKRATKLTTASAATFMGMAEHTNPEEQAGSQTYGAQLTRSFLTVQKRGLVELVWAGGSVTVYGYDPVYPAAADAQSIQGTGSTVVGRIDPGFAGTGKAVVNGDLVKFWLTPASTYDVTG